jgi:hypothetical protein
LYRLAGIPAVGVSADLNGASHIEAYCYLNGEWRVAAEWHSSDLDSNGLTRTLIEYNKDLSRENMINNPLGGTWPAVVYYAPDIVEDDPVSPRLDYLYEIQEVLDIDESWVSGQAKMFMFNLLSKPYAYPDRKLTRGEVAKMLCRYINVVPMRNEQIYTDVPTNHKYSRYIWAMKQLGIMNGNGDGTFRPDSELSMQEFAVMAMRVLECRSQQLSESAAIELQEIESNPTDWPPDLQYTQDVVRRLKEKIDWKPRIAKISSSSPKIFADDAKIASWAKPAVDEFSKFGILQGDSAGSDSRLNPTEPLSKTRFLVFMFKFEEKLGLFIGEFQPTPVF